MVAITHIYIHRSTHSQPYVSMATMLHNPDPTESLRQLPSIIPTFVEPYYEQRNIFRGCAHPRAGPDYEM